MGKYFGTDGIRGKYGDNLDVELSYKTGRAVAAFFGGGSCYIGRDTRVSGPDIEDALVRGLTDGGSNAVLLGVLPTPAVAHLTVSHEAVCGIMISASHNPPEYNGIKIFDGFGVKLSEEQEGGIEYYIDNLPELSDVKGKVSTLENAKNEYIDYVVGCIDYDFKGLEVWLDCGYGASGSVAKEIFERVGTKPQVDNCSMRGEKINAGCGALHPDYVGNSMKGTGCRVGFSFDGDADRLAVVFDGEILDGDSVLYNMSKGLKLKGGVVVGTVLSNLALEKKLASDGLRLLRTSVGDKFICEMMTKNKYNLGGEQSGHYIIHPQATTGDGIMSALIFLKTLCRGGKLSAPERLDLCPQKAIAVNAPPTIVYEAGFIALVEKYTENLRGIGRIVARYSGTEPKVRVMVECSEPRLVDAALKEFENYITARR